ncbi:MAG: metalloregulator ArsR/SmtB family transcription factor [Chloroflexi bacterium]|nr:metalloregulator ArsR/SmtB family transcription factor [Chloroflexota bacterium]
MRDLLQIFKAMADETRLRILYLLMEREACVLEIKQAMRISQTRASRNLGILHDAGLLQARREGPLVFYSLDTKFIKQNCNGLEAMVKQAFDLDQTALLHRERLKRPVARLTDTD